MPSLILFLDESEDGINDKVEQAISDLKVSSNRNVSKAGFILMVLEKYFEQNKGG